MLLIQYIIHNTGVLCPGTNCGMGIFLDDATEQTSHVECSECGVCISLFLSHNFDRPTKSNAML